MDQAELLRRFVGEIEKLGLPYLVTGSMATIDIWRMVMERKGP